MRGLTNIKGQFLDLIFPKLCLNCRRELDGTIDRKNLLCGQCFGSIIVNRQVFHSRGFFFGAATFYRIDAVRNLVRFLKYEDFPGVKYPISEIVKTYLRKSDFLALFRQPPHPELVPVPLHFMKSISRGFNQAEDLAAILSAATGWPVNNRLLCRIKNTRPQAQLEQKSERLKNLSGSFRVDSRQKEAVSGKTLIVVDDVFTSGATMAEAIKTLKSAGARKVIGFVFAKS
ncbi:MAG: hypothetical protein M1586_02130 [Patescibacteria group bacterium]|nr:hypothetical protein [Patescibacteria group bacterium]MCL5262079.1 hypothetical protein [Patescibacteria group bacterium]